MSKFAELNYVQCLAGHHHLRHFPLQGEDVMRGIRTNVGFKLHGIGPDWFWHPSADHFMSYSLFQHPDGAFSSILPGGVGLSLFDAAISIEAFLTKPAHGLLLRSIHDNFLGNPITLENKGEQFMSIALFFIGCACNQ